MSQDSNSTFQDGQPPSTRELRSRVQLRQLHRPATRSYLSTAQPTKSDAISAFRTRNISSKCDPFLDMIPDASIADVSTANSDVSIAEGRDVQSTRRVSTTNSDASIAEGRDVQSTRRPVITEGGILQSKPIHTTESEDSISALPAAGCSTPSTTDDDSLSFRTTVESKPRDECIMPSRFDAPLFESAEEYIRHRDRHRLRQIQFDMLMAGISIANNSDSMSVGDLEDRVLQRLNEFGVDTVTYTPQDDHVQVNTNVDNFTFELTNVSPDNTVTVVNSNILPQIEHRERSIVVPKTIRRRNDEHCCICNHPEFERQLDRQDPMVNCKHILNNGCALETQPRNGQYFVNTFSVDLALNSSSYDRKQNFMPQAHDINEALKIIVDDDMTEIPSPAVNNDTLMKLSIEMLNSLVLKDLLTYHYCIINAKYEVEGNKIRQVFFT